MLSAQLERTLAIWERLSQRFHSGDSEKKAYVRRILRAFLSPLLSSRVSSARILDLFKRSVKSQSLITCYSCHNRPDSALEKAGKTEMSWPILYNVTSAPGSWSHAVDGRREMGWYMYTFVPVGYSPAGDSWKFSWLVHYPGGGKELIFTRLCTGELLSWLLLI